MPDARISCHVADPVGDIHPFIYGHFIEHLAECIDGFSVNQDVLANNLARNPILVTALNPLVGYRKAAEIAKRAMRENRPILDIALEMTDIEASRLTRLLDPARLAHPHREENE